MKERDVMVAGDDLSSTERQAVEEITGKKAPRKRWGRAAAKGKRRKAKRAHEASVHGSREQEAREAEAMHELQDEPWVQPGSLPHIPARKGFVQRWIRVANRERGDHTNIARKQREGWRPRKADTLPKDFPVPRIEHGQYAGCIGIEGMVLMEMTAERNAQRNAFFEQRNKRQLESLGEAATKVNNEVVGTSFGRIVREEERSAKVREVPVARD